MQQFKVILSDAVQEGSTVSVVTAHSLSMQFQNVGPVNGQSNDLSEGNFSISGKQSLLLADGKTMDTDLPKFNIRLKELEALIPTLSGEAQANAQARFDIWSACLASIQGALNTAMKAQYALDEGGQG